MRTRSEQRASPGRWLERGARLLSLVIGLLLPFVAVPSLYALDPSTPLSQLMLDSWRSEDGLPQNSVTAIRQTRDGYLWLGTEEGLVRFDGVRFTTFDTHNTPELGQNFVLSLFEDPDGRLWIGTYGGLTSYQNGHFQHFGKEQGLPADQVRALLRDRRGRLWIGTLGGGVARMEGARIVPEAATRALKGKRIRALAEDRDGTIWMATEEGLIRWAEGKAEQFMEGTMPRDLRALWLDRAGTLWIGSDGGGLLHLDGGRVTALTTKNGLRNDQVRALDGDRDGNLWIGTWGGGIQRLHDGKLASLATGDGFPGDQIWDIHEDREGSIWIGTDGGGLARLKDGRFIAFTAREGLTSPVAMTLLEDRNGTLWVGTYGGGLFRKTDAGFTAITTREGLSNDSVQCLREMRDGSIWAGTSGGGINRLAHGNITRLTTSDGLTSDQIRVILEGRDGTVWIGTDGGGLNRWSGGMVTSFTTATGLSSDVVLALLEDHAGTLWIGTDGGGLERLENGRLTRVAAGSALEVVSALHEDAAGNVWIGTTGGGLARLRDGKLTRITTAKGLFDDTIFSLVEDGTGDLWMTSNKGVFRAPMRELEEVLDGRRDRVTSTAYGVPDGLKSVECNAGSPAAIRAHDGGLWFATLRGIVRTDATRLRPNEVIPPVVIEGARVDGHAVPVRVPLVLKPGKHALELAYTALSLRNPGRVRFRYRLEGFDDEWVDAGTRRTAYYTNVPHGDYQFQVRASNDDGIWNEHGASLPVSVQPRIIETMSFRLFLLLVAAAILAALYAMRMRRLHARMDLREKELLGMVAKAREMGSYRLEEIIGRGAMGEVHRATHRMLARPAAIKLMSAEAMRGWSGEEAQISVQRFHREAEAAARLRCPHTVQLYDFGLTEDGTLYLVMELLDGMNLQTLIRRHGPLPAGRVIFILRQLCASLEEAHASGMVHRDIKPANIHLGRLGLQHDFVKVLDFGLVKSTRGAQESESILSEAGKPTGTPAYMAPEGIQGQEVDARADIYSAGCVAYFLLTGQLVFEAENVIQSMWMAVHDMPAPPSGRAPHPIPAELDALILSCLAKRPSERPAMASELDAMLAAVAVEEWSEADARRWWDTVEPHSSVNDDAAEATEALIVTALK